MPSVLIRSLIKKNLMSICRDFFPAYALPFFSSLMALSLSCSNMFPFMSYPCSLRKFGARLCLANSHLRQPLWLLWSSWYLISAISDTIKASVPTVGDVLSDLSYLSRCGRPSATVLPLIRPSRFSFTRFIALKVSFHC